MSANPGTEKQNNINNYLLFIIFRWHTQHEYIEKLNMQAILDANRNTHEYVREAIVNNDKVKEN